MDVTVNVQHTWQFNLETTRELIIGRADPDTGTKPDIDLGEFYAYERGVSRRHAAIACREHELYVVDLYSANGTFVNDVRLFPQQPRLLKAGDEIRVGRAVLRVRF